MTTPDQTSPTWQRIQQAQRDLLRRVPIDSYGFQLLALATDDETEPRTVNRRPAAPLGVVRLIKAAAVEGWTASAIARYLNAYGIPTTRGGRAWHASGVGYIIKSRAATALMVARDDHYNEPAQYDAVRNAIVPERRRRIAERRRARAEAASAWMASKPRRRYQLVPQPARPPR